MFKVFWGSKEQKAQPHVHNSTESFYPPPVVNSPSSSGPSTPTSGAFSGLNLQEPAERQNYLSHISPADAARIVTLLKDKSIDELKKLWSDKDAYQNLLHSLDPVKTQNKVRDELQNETLQHARKNLEKEPLIMELRNQCQIIRTSELAGAKERLNELERQKQETLKLYSPASILNQLQEDMDKTEEESEALHRHLLDKEIDLSTFLQTYKNLRKTCHKHALIQLESKSSVTA